MDTTMNITRPDLGFAPRTARRRLAARPEALPRERFAGELMARGLAHIAQDSFRGEVSPGRLAELAEPVLVRSDPSGDEVEALLRLPGAEIALLDAGHGDVSVDVAGTTRAAADAAAATLRRMLATEAPDPDRVSIAFWMQGGCGGEVRHREIEAPAFTAIAQNYPGPVAAAVQQLSAMRTPARGRLILWRGAPGTGKSHALRALARGWAPWCSAHFIMDPEELFGRGGAYMLDVLTWDGDDGEGRWRLVILEDAGELIAADARAVAGQALSRLLNVADGLLGQGTRTLVLITTNEPLKRLHPATHRPGRCLADVEFTPFTVEEANAWLAAHGHDRRVSAPTPLAELYAGDEDAPAARDTAPTGFGFGRALAPSTTRAR